LTGDGDKLVLGWREWVRLPEFGVRLIKAKIDTGATTSALHAEEIRFVRRRGKRYVRFRLLPKQHSARASVDALAPLVGERWVRSSNGSREHRPVIATIVDVGGREWPIEVTLTNRDLMGFRMLLGRQALHERATVDPSHSYLTRKVKRRKRPS